MDVKVYMFSLEMGDGIALERFFQHLDSLNGKKIPFKGYQRMIYVGERDSFHTGLFLTIKDQRRFCLLEESPEGVNIEVQEIGRDTSLLDFNILIINKITARGFYMHYHHSCSVNQFCFFLREQYKDLKRKLIDEERNGGVSAKRAAKKYKGLISWDIKLNEEDFETAVEALSRINSFDVSFSTLQPESDGAQPHNPLVKTARHGVTFDKRARFGDALRFVKDKLDEMRGNPNQRATVVGRDAEGLEEIVRLVRMPSSFGEYDFDKITGYMNIPVAKFNDSTVVAELIRLSAESKALLEYEEA